MDNKILERELNNNYEYNEIFTYQRYGTLESVSDVVKENKELLFEININNIIPYYKHRSKFKYESEEEYRFWNHIISILFITELKEKYDIDILHYIDEEKKIVTKNEFDDYLKYEHILLNREDVIEILKKLNIKRLHLIVRYVNNEYIWKEIVNYLQNDLPFITMIYSDGDIYKTKKDGIGETSFVEDVYGYKKFDRYEEGIEIKSIRKKEKVYEKKI